MISGFAQTLQSGRGVSAAGDVNSDGLDDVLVSAAYGYSNYYYGNSGGNFVVFGKTSGATVELESVTRGTGGFVIHGSNSYYYYYNNGQRVSGAGDINGDGLDDIVIGDPYDYSGYSYGGTTYVIFSPAPVPLAIGVRDGNTGEPIVTAKMYVERSDAPVGFQLAFGGVDQAGDATFFSPDADVVDYNVQATGEGYFPSDPVLVRPDDTGDTVTSIVLFTDDELEASGTLRVSIALMDSEMNPTGLKLLTDTVSLSQDSSDLEIPPIFGIGEMVFLGVPTGTIDISIPDTADFDFDPLQIQMGPGITKDVVVIATLVEPASPLTRAELPGQIVGTVENTATVPASPLPNSLIINTQESTGISTFTQASNTGVYFFPNIIPGLGEVQAFSENGNIRGTVKSVDVVTGDVFGNDGGEDTLISVTLNRSDADFDDLPDDYENAFFGSPTSAQTGNDDFDGDGLTNFEEFTLGTDPTVQDSDADGVDDGVEVASGTDALDDPSTPEVPADVWVDFSHTGAEFGTLTNPFSLMQNAIDAVQTGSTITIKGGVDTTTGVLPSGIISKLMTIDALGGTVRIR